MPLEYSTSIPHAILVEHDALHAELERATKLPALDEGGGVGLKIRDLERRAP